jgi:hypothetical protein
MTAAMKNVLSPISEAKIIDAERTKPSSKSTVLFLDDPENHHSSDDDDDDDTSKPLLFDMSSVYESSFPQKWGVVVVSLVPPFLCGIS